MISKSAHLPIEGQLQVAVDLFTQFRWMPPLVIISGGFLLKHVFGFDLSMSALVQIATGIALYNAFLMWRQTRWKPQSIEELQRCVNLHMFFDYFSITLLVYFTGGVLSPLVWFYSIHIIISCIFFKKRKVVWTTFVLWCGLVIVLMAENVGLLPHQPVYGVVLPRAENMYDSSGLLFAVLAGTAVLWSSIIWIVTMIIDHIRIAEREERDMQVKFRAMLDKLTQAQQERDLYRRSMTHDMRSPIAAAQSLLNMLLSGALGAFTDKQHDGLTRASRRLSQMMQMIQDLLTIERSSRAEFVREAIPLDVYVKRIVEEYFEQIEERGIHLNLQLDPLAVAYIDRDDAETILRNLISNAVKYSRDGGELRVVASRGKGVISMEVADTGIGISAKDQERLFAEFYRAGNAKRHSAHGTGLGLAIIKKLVEQNNGAIHLQSELDQGTTFTLTLPEAPKPPSGNVAAKKE